jgi:hypothetical protein
MNKNNIVYAELTGSSNTEHIALERVRSENMRILSQWGVFEISNIRRILEEKKNRNRSNALFFDLRFDLCKKQNQKISCLSTFNV